MLVLIEAEEDRSYIHRGQLCSRWIHYSKSRLWLWRKERQMERLWSWWTSENFRWIRKSGGGLLL